MLSKQLFSQSFSATLSGKRTWMLQRNITLSTLLKHCSFSPFVCAREYNSLLCSVASSIVFGGLFTYHVHFLARKHVHKKSGCPYLPSYLWIEVKVALSQKCWLGYMLLEWQGPLIQIILSIQNSALCLPNWIKNFECSLVSSCLWVLNYLVAYLQWHS